MVEPETMLEFPKVETIETPRPVVVADSAEEQPVSDARKKFNRAALRVLSQVMDRREIQQIEEEKETSQKEENTPQQQEEKKTKQFSLQELPNKMATPRRLSSTDPPTSVQLRRRSRHNSHSSFVNLVRLASYQNRGLKKKDRKNSMDRVDEQDPLDLIRMPDKPRFCATMSPEAQYSMLKCYEDVLFASLKEKVSREGGMLCRVKTPHHRINALHLVGLTRGEDTGSGLLNRYSQASVTSMRSEASTYYSGIQEDFPSITSRPRQESLPPLVDVKDSTRSQTFTVPKDKQLRLSQKFQTAMDILDTLKTSQGKMVTSSRVQDQRLNPLKTYNSWSQAWAREFQYEVNGKTK